MSKNQKKLGASVNEKDAGEGIQRLARELHAALFPEEYDHMYDSRSEAKDRLRSINPMNAEYIEKANALRAQLGFAPFNVGLDARNDDTFAWVLEKLRQGEEGEIRAKVVTRAHEASEAELQRERLRQQLQTPSWLDQRIDEMLPGEKFIYDEQDRTSPHVIAFRILGELFSINGDGNNKPEFFRQIRRLLPDRSKTEYQDLYRHAMNEWMEAYGY